MFFYYFLYVHVSFKKNNYFYNKIIKVFFSNEIKNDEGVSGSWFFQKEPYLRIKTFFGLYTN